VAGVTVGFLDASMIRRPGRTTDSWEVAEVFLPSVGAGYCPSLVTLLNARARRPVSIPAGSRRQRASAAGGLGIEDDEVGAGSRREAGVGQA
jgi:hypothetical protein